MPTSRHASHPAGAGADWLAGDPPHPARTTAPTMQTAIRRTTIGQASAQFRQFRNGPRPGAPNASGRSPLGSVLHSTGLRSGGCFGGAVGDLGDRPASPVGDATAGRSRTDRQPSPAIRVSEPTVTRGGSACGYADDPARRPVRPAARSPWAVRQSGRLGDIIGCLPVGQRRMDTRRERVGGCADRLGYDCTEVSNFVRIGIRSRTSRTLSPLRFATHGTRDRARSTPRVRRQRNGQGRQCLRVGRHACNLRNSLFP